MRSFDYLAPSRRDRGRPGLALHEQAHEEYDRRANHPVARWYVVLLMRTISDDEQASTVVRLASREDRPRLLYRRSQ